MPESITLEFDPFVLPSTQHRAGLAGLIVLIETLKNRGVPDLPQVEHIEDGRIRATFSESGVHRLFCDLYEAAVEEQPRSKRISSGKGAAKKVLPPKREEQVESAEGKSSTVYYYDQVVPRAPFLEALQLPDPWLKLWRDAVWTCIRGVPQTRIPFEERSEGKNTTEAAKTWHNLERFAKSRMSNGFHTVDLAGCLYLGSQAVHADRVPFVGRTDEALLLHFWPVVMTVSVPLAIDREGNRKRKGYLLTLPDVCDYRSFPMDFREFTAGRSAEMEGIYPKDASIAIPEEGALEYLANLAAIARARSKQSMWSFSAMGAEVYHLDKRGNNVPLLYTARVRAEARLLGAYEAMRRQYHHVLFRRQLVLNLLRDVPWYRGFERVFGTQPQTLFLGNTGRFFQVDLERKLKLEREVLNHA